jgi:hypothetical protein
MIKLDLPSPVVTGAQPAGEHPHIDGQPTEDGMPLHEPRFQRFREAYLRMAKDAKYRPQAPGGGHVDLSRGELRDKARLDREASEYAIRFAAEEDTLKFWTGVTDFETNRAFVWTIEAARALAGAHPKLALKLLEMAAEDVRQARPSILEGARLT